MTIDIFLLLLLATVLGSSTTLIIFCVVGLQSEYIAAHREEENSEFWPACSEERVFFDPETNYRAGVEPRLTSQETHELKNTLLLLRDVLEGADGEETVKIGEYRYDTSDLTGATSAIEKLLGGSEK